ncbi:MAG: hypothetical protein COT74_03900 [Bdellovibrionales bacterium CG10_big_fil_rev_8_21_14_0_10_45_34]|nr:MAG: hypothetical protein COT74_03900 [Bdellovibrionales bacterium CG10_big_fil_rev_8_21_14_0_10_45_34]
MSLTSQEATRPKIRALILVDLRKARAFTAKQPPLNIEFWTKIYGTKLCATRITSARPPNCIDEDRRN